MALPLMVNKTNEAQKFLAANQTSQLCIQGVQAFFFLGVVRWCSIFFVVLLKFSIGSIHILHFPPNHVPPIPNVFLATLAFSQQVFPSYLLGSYILKQNIHLNGLHIFIQFIIIPMEFVRIFFLQLLINYRKNLTPRYAQFVLFSINKRGRICGGHGLSDLGVLLWYRRLLLVAYPWFPHS